MSCGWRLSIPKADLFIRRDPLILQLIGGSRFSSRILFEVYRMPGENLESLKGWVRWTHSSNPLEFIYGFHVMVCGDIYEVVLILMGLLDQHTSVLV